jgi:homoserine kinase
MGFPKPHFFLKISNPRKKIWGAKSQEKNAGLKIARKNAVLKTLIKNAALENGALGSGISGAGPSIFALCKEQKIAEKVAYAMSNAYLDTGIAFDMHISKVNDQGTKII